MPNKSDDIIDEISDGDLSPSDVDTYQKEVLLSIYNLWQITRQHEDDLRALVDVLKSLNKNVTTLLVKINTLQLSNPSTSPKNNFLLYILLGSNIFFTLLLILFIVFYK